MGKTVRVMCDGCGHDLTTRSNSVDYRLVLGSESKPGYGSGVYTDMVIYPPTDRDYYFCGIPCLDHWRSRGRHQAEAWVQALTAWREERGTKDEGGRIRSYPLMPEEMSKRLDAEFAAAALAAFPMES